MEGIMKLQPTGEYVGKKSEYKTRHDFALAIKQEECLDIEAEDVGEGYMRYYPKGTEDSEHEFGKGIGVYMNVDKPAKGTFDVWVY